MRSKVKHIVFIVQENRSFDNLFHGLRNADYADFGMTHDHRRIRLRPISYLAKFDISNGYEDFAKSYDYGRMDGYDLRKVGLGPGALGKRAKIAFATYAFLPRPEVEPYFELANQYVVGDRMFQSNIDQSFSAHLFLIAGQAGHVVNVPTQKPWGCDGGPTNTIQVLNKLRKPSGRVYPCFTFKTLASRLEDKALTWRYYAPHTDSKFLWQTYMKVRPPGYPTRSRKQPDFGQVWSAFDAIAPVRYGPEWYDDVVSPETEILRDARRGRLASVSWVVPDWKNSDHPLSLSATGPDWVSSIVNAIGEGPRWKDTVIAITWDDSGGWYDHVPPPQLDQDGLGVRVPLILVSAYSKRNVVSHSQYEFGSMLKFAEQIFDLKSLAASDRRASSFWNCFDFTQPARRFVPIRTRRTANQFLQELQSGIPPDRD